MRTFAFKIDPMTGEEYYEVYARGRQLLNDPHLNKASSFTREERSGLGLEGLVRSAVLPLEHQAAKAYDAFLNKSDDLDKYIFLVALQDRSEVIFYRLVADHLKEMMPIVYTPTVGTACLQMSNIQRRFRGIYITPENIDAIDEVFRNITLPQVNLIVVTDGERILGLGDLGSDGMGIPVGKVSLYVAAGGLHPHVCLPICLDVGTNNPRLLEDPTYLGYRQPRLCGEAYDKVVDTFVLAVKRHFPEVLLQWEDFGKATAYRNLERYRDRILSFNDDIQITGATVLAALMTAMRIKGSRLSAERYLVAGMGQAGTSIALSLLAALAGEGLSPEEARARVFGVDVQGLLLEDDPTLEEPQRPMAQRRETVAGWQRQAPDRVSLVDVVRNARPTVLIGVSAQTGLFSEAILQDVARNTDRPIVFALSIPTSKCECTPEQVWKATGGKGLVATGSTFRAMEWNGRIQRTSQCSNTYIFPGVGLGALVGKAAKVTDGMLFAASRALSAMVTPEQEALGLVLPEMEDIRKASAAVALAVARQAREEGHGCAATDEELARMVAKAQWEPRFAPYRAG